MMMEMAMHASSQPQLIQDDFEPVDSPPDQVVDGDGTGIAELKWMIEKMAEEMRAHFHTQAVTLAILSREKYLPANADDTSRDDMEASHDIMNYPVRDPTDPDDDSPGSSGQDKNAAWDSLEAETDTHTRKARLMQSRSFSEQSPALKEPSTSTFCPMATLQIRRAYTFLQWLVSRKSFEMIVMCLIFANVVVVGIEVDMAATLASDEVSPAFVTLDRTFTVIFLVELLLKIVCLGCRRFFNGPEKYWNIFDLFIVGVSVTESVFSLVTSLENLVSASHLRMLRIFRLARAFRSIRIIRLLRFIATLRMLMHAIINTFRSLVWTLCLLIMIFYIFGLAFTQAISDHCRLEAIETTGDVHATPRCKSDAINTQWSSLSRSMFTLLKTTTNGIDWQEVADPLFDISLVLVFVFIVYFCFMFFAVLNVVTGVCCHTAIESANSDKDIATRLQLMQRRSFVQKIKTMFQDIDVDGSNSITIAEFERTLSDEHMKAYLASIDVNAEDAWTLFSLIDKDMSGVIDLDEFVAGCLNLRGPAKAVHIAKMGYENKHMRQMVKTLLDSQSSLLVQVESLSRRWSSPEFEWDKMAASKSVSQSI
eukprot:TRINITY_DN51822_c0_g1_i1.p1 TRINITY_DN51822_c0_g1~~TRINITY_DN51822_c0_g1_i1.p1  ORF type:complete len:594 (-),score=98.31 TRINITY_DN51822_c0_g1_i1:287-2068(-)